MSGAEREMLLSFAEEDLRERGVADRVTARTWVERLDSDGTLESLEVVLKTRAPRRLLGVYSWSRDVGLERTG